MRRRQVLAAIAVGSTVGVGGCVDGGAGGNETPTESDTPTATPTDSPTPTSEPTAIVDSSLERLGDCAEGDVGTGAPTVESGVVTVEGCLRGKNGCIVPQLESAAYDEGSDTLEIVVVPFEDGEMCTQQIVYRSYRVTVEFTGRPPGNVTLVQDQGTETDTMDG